MAITPTRKPREHPSPSRGHGYVISDNHDRTYAQRLHAYCTVHAVLPVITIGVERCFT